jgi:serine/threonine-protein kinase
MSPEQARGEPFDHRGDVYGLGAVVYEMVTGAPPFIDRTLASLYARVMNEPPPRASDVAIVPLPRGLDEILSRALAKDPAERFETVAAFVAALPGPIPG